MADDPRRGHKIGVLVPYTNVNLEPDMIIMCPKGCTLHFERLGDYDVDAIPGSDQMAGLGAAEMNETLRLIAGVRPAAVLYGCTSATLTQGVAFDHDLSAKIGDRLGAVSLTAAGSLVRGIRALGVTKVGFASPYVGDINQHAVSFLADEGIETIMQADIGRTLGNYEQGELKPAEVFDLAVRAANDTSLHVPMIGECITRPSS